jgi:hypothetical protein
MVPGSATQTSKEESRRQDTFSGNNVDVSGSLELPYIPSFLKKVKVKALPVTGREGS